LVNNPGDHLPFPEVSNIGLQTLTVGDLSQCVGHFPDFTQPAAADPNVGLPVPVEMWQYGGNVSFTGQWLMDLDFTIAANATDHMARFP
jgi:hypothetical protein